MFQLAQWLHLLDNIVLMHKMSQTLIFIRIRGSADLAFVFLGCTTFVSQMSQQIGLTGILTIAVIGAWPRGFLIAGDFVSIICKIPRAQLHISRNSSLVLTK